MTVCPVAPIRFTIEPTPTAPDRINHPSHYGHGKIEVAVAMDLLGAPEQWLGHALKYACRAPHKGSEIEDLRKAIWCTEHAVELGAHWQTPLRLTPLRLTAREVIADALSAGIPDDASGPSADVRALTVLLIRWLVTMVGESPVERLRAALDGAK